MSLKDDLCACIENNSFEKFDALLLEHNLNELLPTLNELLHKIAICNAVAAFNRMLLIPSIAQHIDKQLIADQTLIPRIAYANSNYPILNAFLESSEVYVRVYEIDHKTYDHTILKEGFIANGEWIPAVHNYLDPKIDGPKYINEQFLEYYFASLPKRNILATDEKQLALAGRIFYQQYSKIDPEAHKVIDLYLSNPLAFDEMENPSQAKSLLESIYYIRVKNLLAIPAVRNSEAVKRAIARYKDVQELFASKTYLPSYKSSEIKSVDISNMCLQSYPCCHDVTIRYNNLLPDYKDRMDGVQIKNLLRKIGIRDPHFEEYATWQEQTRSRLGFYFNAGR